jgi:adenosylcobinamide-phosphate synthase
MFRAIVILSALILDLIFGDPPNRFHPLMLMGRWLSFGRRLALSRILATRRQFWFGAIWTLVGVGLFAWPFWKLESKRGKKQPNAQKHKNQKISSLHPFGFAQGKPSSFIPSASFRASLHPLFLKPIFAYRGLRRAVKAVASALENNDLAEARRLLSWHLVSRDTSELSEAEVVGAAIESLTENLTDSLTAPLLAYAAGGLPAAWAYRFINTADAMWGYRTPEFEQLGKFPAHLDDALNWLPARLTGWLLVMAAWLSGNDGRNAARNAARTMLTQHHHTASPNAGWSMSAMAGALGVTLTKRGLYELAGGQNELNVITIKRALRLADICVGLSVAAICAGLIAARVFRQKWIIGRRDNGRN